MAIRQILIDDVTGKEGDDIETVTFAFKGVSYEIDLGDETEKDLAGVLDPYIKVARRVTQSRASAPRSTGSSTAREDSRAARAWAQGAGEKILTDAGIKVPGDRGRVDSRVVELWEKAGKPKA